MYDLKFQNYLSENTGVDIYTIGSLFDKHKNDVFAVALELIEHHGISDSQLGKLWGSYLGFAYVDPNSSIVNREYVDKVGVEFILDNSVMPLYKFGKAVTTSNPKNLFVQDKLEKRLGELVSFVFCFPFDIDICIQRIGLKK